MARKIVLTSGKGGVGKTTICANLGVNLAALGFRTVLVDVDIGLNNLDVVMGLEKQVVFDITDVIMGRCRAKQALVEDVRFPNLFLLPSSHYSGKTRILGEHVAAELIRLLDERKEQLPEMGLLSEKQSRKEAGVNRSGSRQRMADAILLE